MKSYAIQQKCSNELGESQPNLQQAQFQKKFGRRTHCANIQDIIMRCRNIKRKWQRTCVGRRRIVNFFIDSQVSLSGICGSIRICYCQQNRVITRNLETKKLQLFQQAWSSIYMHWQGKFEKQNVSGKKFKREKRVERITFKICNKNSGGKRWKWAFFIKNAN